MTTTPTYAYDLPRTRLQGASPGGEGDFDLALRMVDSWEVEIAKDGQAVKIASATVEPATVYRWESEHSNEVLASFTGYSLPGSGQVVFDEGAGPKSLTGPVEAPVDGLQIILARVDDVPYEPDATHGGRPLQVTVVDTDGITHNLVVAFPADASARHRTCWRSPPREATCHPVGRLRAAHRVMPRLGRRTATARRCLPNW